MRMMVTILLEKNTLPRDYRPWISKLIHLSLSKQGGESFWAGNCAGKQLHQGYFFGL